MNIILAQSLTNLLYMAKLNKEKKFKISIKEAKCIWKIY